MAGVDPYVDTAAGVDPWIQDLNVGIYRCMEYL